MLVTHGWSMGQATTTASQLRPFCCLDFSAKKSTNLSFVLGWGCNSSHAIDKPSFSLDKHRKSLNLHCCRCDNNGNSSTSSSPSLDWDWHRWNRHFSEVEQAESFASVLKFQLEDAIEKEEFQEAARLKMAIAEATSKDTVAEIMTQLKNSIDEERYHEASRLCKCTGSGLVGWWVGYSTDSDDPFGRLIRITPGVGRFVGRSYSPSQLATASPGTPLFEIFVVKDADESYVMQVVYLQRAKGASVSSKSSRSKSVKGPSTSEVENTSVADAQGNEVKEENGKEKIINFDEATEENIKRVINFIKDKIPGLKVEVVNVDAAEVIEDSDAVKQMMQEDDEDTESSDNSEDEGANLSEIETDGISLGGGSHPSEEGKKLEMKLFIGGIVPNNEDAPSKNEYVRFPAEIKNMERDSFILHVPERSPRYDSRETEALKVKVAAMAAKGISELMPPDVAEAFWSADKVSSRVSKDVREIVKIAVTQAQKGSGLSAYTTFSRINTSSSKFDPFDGLYVGAFGPYRTEVVQLRRKFGRWNDDKSSDVEFFEYVEAVKLTGDLNVPAGQVTFRAKIGKGSRKANRGMYPDELGVVATYSGQGRIAEVGFKNPGWVTGELLQLNGKGIGPLPEGAGLGFLYIVPKRSFLVLLNRLKLPD